MCLLLPCNQNSRSIPKPKCAKEFMVESDSKKIAYCCILNTMFKKEVQGVQLSCQSARFACERSSVRFRYLHCLRRCLQDICLYCTARPRPLDVQYITTPVHSRYSLHAYQCFTSWRTVTSRITSVSLHAGEKISVEMHLRQNIQFFAHN